MATNGIGHQLRTCQASFAVLKSISTIAYPVEEMSTRKARSSPMGQCLSAAGPLEVLPAF